jgi:hypothetical protein
MDYEVPARLLLYIYLRVCVRMGDSEVPTCLSSQKRAPCTQPTTAPAHCNGRRPPGPSADNVHQSLPDAAANVHLSLPNAADNVLLSVPDAADYRRPAGPALRRWTRRRSGRRRKSPARACPTTRTTARTRRCVCAAGPMIPRAAVTTRVPWSTPEHPKSRAPRGWWPCRALHGAPGAVSGRPGALPPDRCIRAACARVLLSTHPCGMREGTLEYSPVRHARGYS